MWGLGCLIWETYNGTLNTTSQLKIAGQVSPFALYYIFSSNHNLLLDSQKFFILEDPEANNDSISRTNRS